MADDATAASVRRLGSLERQVEHLSVVVARLDDSVTALDGTVGDQLPRLHHEVVAASAMIDAVAAQVAADTDALSRRLEGIEPRSRRPWWRRLFRREA